MYSIEGENINIISIINMYFGIKYVWVPKTYHQGPKIKRVPNIT